MCVCVCVCVSRTGMLKLIAPGCSQRSNLYGSAEHLQFLSTEHAFMSTLLAAWILRWRPDFWKVCGPVIWDVSIFVWCLWLNSLDWYFPWRLSRLCVSHDGNSRFQGTTNVSVYPIFYFDVAQLSFLYCLFMIAAHRCESTLIDVKALTSFMTPETFRAKSRFFHVFWWGQGTF